MEASAGRGWLRLEGLIALAVMLGFVRLGAMINLGAQSGSAWLDGCGAAAATVAACSAWSALRVRSARQNSAIAAPR
jgi:hypothetical protein